MQSNKDHIEDSFGRKHNYLRISLTDRCNLRCRYCMPVEKMKFMPAKMLMSSSEIVSMAGEFRKWGVDRIRLTGGEPLIRPDFDEIIAELGRLDVKMSLTTNAYFLDQHLQALQNNGVNHLNISLDTLQSERFQALTRRNGLEKTIENIRLAKANNFLVKINVVLMKGINDDEVLDFAEFAVNENVEVRFIEFMPFQDNEWDMSKIVAEQDVLQSIGERYHLEPLINGKNDTSRKYGIDGRGVIGFISSITNPFCDGCNRIRLTADGKLKNCLFSNDEIDLLTAFRSGQEIEPLVRAHMMTKFYARGGKTPFADHDASKAYQDNRKMIAIGG